MRAPPDKASLPDAAIVAVLRECVPDLRAVYRYGSAGSIWERPESDLDLAVLAARPIAYDCLMQCAARLAQLTGKEIDLNDMHRLPVTLRVQIVTEGVRLYAADRREAEEYDSRVLSEYAALNEARRGILADVAARGSIHG
ncbi:MAG: nucleotidyltransferase domain-containing protein [Rhodocyclaceae bacterium]|nr:nucleotidyltransferase domain-containing protein [Rhodocyclaceae bacterium]